MKQYMSMLKAYTQSSVEQLSVSEQVLYFRLFLINNLVGWEKEWFGATTPRMLLETGIASKNTLNKARQRLKDLGYIDFKPGKKGMPTMYRLIEADSYGIRADLYKGSMNDPYSDPYSDPKRDPYSDPIYKTIDKDNDNTPLPHEKGERIPYAQIVGLYHELCPSLPKVAKLTDSRKKAIKGRWQEWDKSLDSFKECFTRVGKSDFLTGKVKEWSASFDWIIKTANFTKIMEGNYTNKGQRSGEGGTLPSHTISQEEQERRRQLAQDHDAMLAAIAEGGE